MKTSIAKLKNAISVNENQELLAFSTIGRIELLAINIRVDDFFRFPEFLLADTCHESLDAEEKVLWIKSFSGVMIGLIQADS